MTIKQYKKDAQQYANSVLRPRIPSEGIHVSPVTHALWIDNFLQHIEILESHILDGTVPIYLKMKMGPATTDETREWPCLDDQCKGELHYNGVIIFADPQRYQHVCDMCDSSFDMVTFRVEVE